MTNGVILVRGFEVGGNRPQSALIQLEPPHSFFQESILMRAGTKKTDSGQVDNLPFLALLRLKQAEGANLGSALLKLHMHTGTHYKQTFAEPGT